MKEKGEEVSAQVSSPPDEEEVDILASVLETSQFFTSLVETLPAKHYLTTDDGDDKGNYGKGKKRKKKKPLDKKLLAKKAKLLKLDPSQHKSVTELQEEIEKKEEEMYKQDREVSRAIKPVKVSEVKATASLAELQEKLHAKIDQLRGGRKILADSNGGDASEEKVKTKMEKKKKKFNMEKKEKEKESRAISRATSIENKAMDNDGENKKINGSVIFNKFDFVNDAHKGEAKKKKKDLNKLLEIAEKKDNKLKELEETDAGKAAEVKKKISWEKALQKAEGTKVKDDSKLLKKTIKRKEKVRAQSAKKWKERVDNVEKQKQEKQKIRKQNIKEKREEKMNKKSGKKKKKKGDPKKKHSPGF